jgi:thiosulfate/3-mercaptopyruvate sulfurtransferase
MMSPKAKTNLWPLISAFELKQKLAQGSRQDDVALFDCSFDLTNPDEGLAQFNKAHIPSARYLHLDADLSAKGISQGLTASGGRHPLPTRETLAKRIGSWGVGPDTLVVVYDRNANMLGGRLWWMLKWCGHDKVVLLDGGWNAWLAAGGETESGPAADAVPMAFDLSAPRVDLVSAQDVLDQLGRPGQTLVDARATPRFKGEVEPLDPAAGHIPGALNRPFSDNFVANGCYKSPETLRREWRTLLGNNPDGVVMHCGSGVSAVPNVVSMVLAGMTTPALFAGSWSEWCADSTRPIAKG